MGLFDNFKNPTLGHSKTRMRLYLQMTFCTSLVTVVFHLRKAEAALRDFGVTGLFDSL